MGCGRGNNALIESLSLHQLFTITSANSDNTNEKCLFSKQLTSPVWKLAEFISDPMGWNSYNMTLLDLAVPNLYL